MEWWAWTAAVALVYDDKQRFRSRALVQVGSPEPVDPWLPTEGHDDHRAVRALTDDLARRLRDVGPDYASWSDADLLAAVAEIVARSETDLPHDVDLADRQRVVERLVGLERSAGGPAALAPLREAEAGYRRGLDRAGLHDAQVAAAYRSGTLRWALAAAVAKVLIALPFAAVGAVVHLVPYQLVKYISRRPDNLGMRATVKLVGCFILFAMTYAALGTVVGLEFGALVRPGGGAGRAGVRVRDGADGRTAAPDGRRPGGHPGGTGAGTGVRLPVGSTGPPSSTRPGSRSGSNRPPPGKPRPGPVLDGTGFGCHHGRTMYSTSTPELLLT